ncbi:hypothetical protein BDP81DRAFT_13844 [Colletotrichum phormii]|uniref:Uncharacterized protein n=1 Tax=Colletotrichum phormii TaxID=359342 RepID=A0AAJ0A3W1_9PEZI|nr:uncharacterized protein BDP81DRAFT_13844 [Colletotrichum phormii]KAK1656000.1 hypothetical protein BDP81DRAFT_13844 [Colletotrichum phormii]
MSQSACPARFNCESADAWEPNSDIAGLRVLIGFVGTGYLVFALLVVHYFVAYEPQLPPPQQTRNDERPSQAAIHEHSMVNRSESRVVNAGTHTDPIHWEPNPIDVKLLAWVRSRTAKLLVFLGASLPLVSKTSSNRVNCCFNMGVVAMCDVQIVTGISILISGFICLDKNLSALHWKIITYLAWFSCVTHLSGLTALRRYFQTHQREKSLRITLMFVLLAILIVAMVPSGFFNWRSPRADLSIPQPTAASAKTSAACFYNLACGKELYYLDASRVNCTKSCANSPNKMFNPHDCKISPSLSTEELDCTSLSKSSAMQEMIISTVMLLFGFFSRVIKLSTHISSTTRRRMVMPMRNCTVGLLLLQVSMLDFTPRCTHYGKVAPPYNLV